MLEKPDGEQDVRPAPDQQTDETSQWKKHRRERHSSIRKRRLWVSIVVIAAAVVLRFAAPQVVDGVRQRAVQAVCGSVDFGAAVQVIGQGLSGEMTFGQALEEAYTYAFQPTWEDAVAAGGNGG